MLVGDAARRTKKGSGLKSQTCFRCYSGPNFGGDNAAPCADAKSVSYIILRRTNTYCFGIDSTPKRFPPVHVQVASDLIFYIQRMPDNQNCRIKVQLLILGADVGMV